MAALAADRTNDTVVVTVDPAELPADDDDGVDEDDEGGEADPNMAILQAVQRMTVGTQRRLAGRGQRP